jgi:hypothetical protein
VRSCCGTPHRSPRSTTPVSECGAPPGVCGGCVGR